MSENYTTPSSSIDDSGTGEIGSVVGSVNGLASVFAFALVFEVAIGEHFRVVCGADLADMHNLCQSARHHLH